MTFPPLGRGSAPSEPAGDRLTLAVVGDCQPALPRTPLSQLTHQIMRELRLLRPAFVLYTGDRIWGYRESRQEMLNAYDRFRALAETVGVPFYAALGNHEMQSDPAAVEVALEAGNELWGSFEAGPYHVVVLNTDLVNLEGRITGAQLAWLEEDLAANAGSAGIFVLMHRPLFSWFQGDFNPDDAAALQALFARYPVRAVFAGHDHFHYEEEHGRIRYITTGGGGGTLYAQPHRGGFAHYLLVHASPEGVDVEVVEPGHLEVVTTAGNDGLEPVSSVRVVNTTERRLHARNLELRAPRLADSGGYRVSTAYVEFDGTGVDLPATIRDVVDNRDGTVTVSVELTIPDGSAFTVTVEARDPEQ